MDLSSSNNNIRRQPELAMRPTCIPADPGDAFFLKFCFVCQEEALLGKEHYNNYGGIVCLSCRAFFRRAHQNSKNLNFKCKFGGNCVITVANRRRCQKCRYKRCIGAGMNPEAVLTESQKIIRFRKLIQKNKDAANSQILSTRKEKRSKKSNESENNEEKDEEILHSEIPSSEEENHEEGTFSNQQESHSVTPSDCSGESDSVSDEDGPQKISSKVRTITETYQRAILQIQTIKSSQFCDKLSVIHSGVVGVLLDRTEVLSYMVTISELFRHFALVQRQFIKLCKSDQRQLLARNTALYIHLLFASYFGASNGAEQLGFVLNFRQQQNTKEDQKAINREGTDESIHLNVHSFNSISNLFKSDSDLQYYSQLINNVNTLQLTGIEQQAILAYIILFDHDSTMSLKEPTALTDINVLNNFLFENCVTSNDSSFSLENLMSTLVKMALFSSYNIEWVETNDVPNQTIFEQTIVMRYTKEEELWLQNQVHLVEDAFRSVPIGDEILEEFTMFSLGVPLSKSFIKQVVSLGAERTWRIFLTQPEFSNLPAIAQFGVKCQKLFSAFALIIARSESYSSGTEQLKFAFGCSDETSWNEKFNKVFGNNTIEKIGFFQAASSLPIFQRGLPSEVSESAVDDAKLIVKDPTLWGLMMLITITEPTEGLMISPLAKLHSRYNLLLQRRQRWISSIDSSDPDKVLTKISSVFSNLNKLAPLLQHMMP